MSVYVFSAECGNSVFQFKISLKNPKPPIWRRVLVPCDYTFKDLHFVIQNIMSWSGTHMYEFELKDPRTGAEIKVGGCGEVDCITKWWHESTKLDFYFKKANDKATYDYDFGSTWQHIIIMEKIVPVDRSMKYPYCINGKRGSPPEHGIPEEIELYRPEFFDPKLITFQEALDYFDEDEDFRGGFSVKNASESSSDESDSLNSPDNNMQKTLINYILRNRKAFSEVEFNPEQRKVFEQRYSNAIMEISKLAQKRKVPEDEEPNYVPAKSIVLESKDLQNSNPVLEMTRVVENSDSDPSKNVNILIVTEDAEDYYGKFIASQMRDIKDLERREDLRLDIQQLITKYRFKN